MATITVFKFTGYDFATDSVCTSRRWATPEFLMRNQFAALHDTAIEVPEEILVDGGLTPRDYNPDSAFHRGGFQRVVR